MTDKVDEIMQRMKAELTFGVRFMPSVPSELAYKQARHCLSGKGGPTPYTLKEHTLLKRLQIDQARRVLLGSVLDQFTVRDA